jgi:hypothetical protein
MQISLQTLLLVLLCICQEVDPADLKRILLLIL